MANFELPRRGSSPHLFLTALNNIGGGASVQTLMSVRNWKGRIALFRSDILARLIRCELVIAVNDQVAITNAGRTYLGIKVESDDDYVGQLPGPRYVAPMRPLNVARHRTAAPMREGALDYMSIPSLMGVESVAYKGAACFTGEVQ